MDALFTVSWTVVFWAVVVPVLLAGVLAFVVWPFYGFLFVLWLAACELWCRTKRWLNPPRAATTAELEEFFSRMRQEEEAAEVKAQSLKKRRLMHVLDRCWDATNKGTVASFFGGGELEYTATAAYLDGLIKPKRHGRRIKGYSITHKGRCAYAQWLREKGVMHDWEVSAERAKSAAEDGPASE